MTWRPQREPTRVGDASIQYLRSDHGEGAHDVTVAGVTVRVLPDDSTSTRKRYAAILEAMATAHAISRWSAVVLVHTSDEDPVEISGWDGSTRTGTADEEFDPVAYLVGYLVTAGIRNIEVEGEPILAPRGQWRLDLREDGSAVATFTGGKP